MDQKLGEFENLILQRRLFESRTRKGLEKEIFFFWWKDEGE